MANVSFSSLLVQFRVVTPLALYLAVSAGANLGGRDIAGASLMSPFDVITISVLAHAKESLPLNEAGN